MNSHQPQAVLERIYPFEMNMSNANDRDSLEIHAARYRFASEQLRGNRILDMACGCGFGTAQMAAAHPDKQFTGIDIDPEAIRYAQQHYLEDNLADNLRYVCADAMTFSGAGYDGGRYDSIVSLETIEHLPDPENFIANLPTLLTSHGRIIASVPVTPTCDGNPHHLHDFTTRNFKKLFKQRGFVSGEELRQVQPWVYKEAFSKLEQSNSRSHGVGNNVMAYYRKHPTALLTRLYSLLRHGSCNIYLTAVFQKTDELLS